MEHYVPYLTWIICVKSYNGITAVRHGHRILQRRSLKLSMYQTLTIQFLHFSDGGGASYLLHGHDTELITMNVKRMIRVVRNTCQK